MQYPKPTDTLEGYTNTLQTYGSYEIWKKDTKRALVDNLTKKIELLYDITDKDDRKSSNI